MKKVKEEGEKERRGREGRRTKGREGKKKNFTNSFRDIQNDYITDQIVLGGSGV